MTNTSDRTIRCRPDGPSALPDDGYRYALTGPRGISPFLDTLSADTLSPDTDHHTITVHGSADLARRLAEADQLGVCVAWRRLDETGDHAGKDTTSTAESTDENTAEDADEM